MTTILQEAAAGRATIVPWTVEQYHRAIDSGLVPEDSAVELLEGFLVRKDRAKAGENPMTIGDRHRVAVVRLAHAALRLARLLPVARGETAQLNAGSGRVPMAVDRLLA